MIVYFLQLKDHNWRELKSCWKDTHDVYISITRGRQIEKGCDCNRDRSDDRNRECKKKKKKK